MAGALGIEDCFASYFKLKIRRALFLIGALLSMYSSCVAFIVHVLVLLHDLGHFGIRVRCVRAFVCCASTLLLATRVVMNISIIVSCHFFLFT